MLTFFSTIYNGAEVPGVDTVDALLRWERSPWGAIERKQAREHAAFSAELDYEWSAASSPTAPVRVAVPRVGRRGVAYGWPSAVGGVE